MNNSNKTYSLQAQKTAWACH